MIPCVTQKAKLYWYSKICKYELLFTNLPDAFFFNYSSLASQIL